MTDRRVPLPVKAADRLRSYEFLIADAVKSRDLYAQGVLEGLGIGGTITGFDEVTGELLLEATAKDDPEPD